MININNIINYYQPLSTIINHYQLIMRGPRQFWRAGLQGTEQWFFFRKIRKVSQTAIPARFETRL